jgi:hypothetical protein
MLQNEAERLNVPLDAVKKTLTRAISKGEIQVIIDSQNEELIRYELEELDGLSEKLSSKRVHPRDLAEEMNLKVEQTRLIIDKLIGDGRIQGVYALDGSFVSQIIIRDSIIDITEKTERIDILEISKKLSIPQDITRLVIEEFSRQVIRATKPYKQIGFAELSQEANLPTKTTVTLLKNLISEGILVGSLDMVNRMLIIERAPETPTTLGRSEVSREQRIRTTYEKPSNAWYFAPIFLGLLGGLIGYIAVKDDDREMAKNLLYLGIGMTFINIIILWGFYSWYISILTRFGF